MTELGKASYPLYTERVVPNFGTFAAVFVLLPSIVIISEPFDLVIGLVTGSVLVSIIWSLLVFRAPKILVTRSELRVGRAKISRELIGEPIAIGKQEIFAERGPNLDPAAHKVFQGSLKTAVKIPIIDPVDPTPYWLVSTRHPKKLIDSLRKL